MKTFRAVCGVLVALWLCSGAAVHAQGLSYLGPNPGAPTGWIEIAPGQVTEVRVGDEIPGWGAVTQIVETHLVVERRLSQAEQDQLRARGAAVYQVLEIQIPRTDLEAEPLSPRQ